MRMNGMEIPKELKCDIELNQKQLKKCIRSHQRSLAKLKTDPGNSDLQQEVRLAEAEVIFIGLEQKTILERLRDEYKAYQKSLKADIVKNGVEEKKANLTFALSRARKQNIVARSASATSFSDESVENSSVHSSPEHLHQHQSCSTSTTNPPTGPQDVTQSEFLNYFSLATHDVYREMQNKRAERKRRSTANPHFLYGNKGWDFLTGNKRKRNAFLVSPISPPQTRQSYRRKQERISPPLPPPVAQATTTKAQQQQEIINNGGPSSNNSHTANKNVFNAFPSIPNLPSGLIIERVSPDNSQSSSDTRFCNICKQQGGLSTCESCSNGFHISCHNRPLTQTPRQCPKCITKEVRTIGALNVPSGMSVSYVTPPEVTAKLNEKKILEEKKKYLAAELTQLQNCHSQLTISLKNQKSQQDQLLNTQQSTEEKISNILSFIKIMQQQHSTTSPSTSDKESVDSSS